MHRVPATTDLLNALRTAPKKNTAPRAEYHQYYDVMGRDLVEHADRAIIERYGYEF